MFYTEKGSVFSKIQDAILLPILKLGCKNTKLQQFRGQQLPQTSVPLMKIEVERAKAAQNKQELIQSVLEAWTTITEQYLALTWFRVYLDV